MSWKKSRGWLQHEKNSRQLKQQHQQQQQQQLAATVGRGVWGIKGLFILGRGERGSWLLLRGWHPEMTRPADFFIQHAWCLGVLMEALQTNEYAHIVRKCGGRGFLCCKQLEMHLECRELRQTD